MTGGTLSVPVWSRAPAFPLPPSMRYMGASREAPCRACGHHERPPLRTLLPFLVALAAACSPSGQKADEAPAPDKLTPAKDAPRHVILVSLDTLRADQTGPYGNTQVRTPTLDALAAEGVVFEQHISAAPTTLASHTALFTGRYSHHHGVPRNDYLVNDDNLMLPEWLRLADFHTGAFLGAMPLASHSGFTQGFDHLDERFTLHRSEGVVGQTSRVGNEVTDAALKWMARQDKNERTFLFVHYFDVHAPYIPPEPWYANTLAAFEGAPKDAGSMGHIQRVRRAVGKGKGARGTELLTALYRAGIEYTDHELGRLFAGLTEQGWMDDAVVIVTSDHGETFSSRTEKWDHGATVFDDTIRTPLIVRLPGKEHAGTRVSVPVSNVDVVPSLAELLGLPAPERVDGTSFLPALTGEAFDRGPVFAEATKPHTEVPKGTWVNAKMDKAVREGSHKLIFKPKAERSWVYDLAADPGERDPVEAENSPAGQALDQAMDRFVQSADPLPSKKQSNARVQAELEALGYVE